MKTDIIISGVGGQGILSIAATIGGAALKKGWFIKQAETHGMSQRGGAVVSHLRISDKPIASDLIPLGKADVIISVEPMESLRYLPYLSEKGCIVSNSTTFENIKNYPPKDAILEEIKKAPRFVILDAENIAKEVKNPKASNMAMLGAASPFINIDNELIEENISEIFKPKGELVVLTNIQAYKKGRNIAKRN